MFTRSGSYSGDGYGARPSTVSPRHVAQPRLPDMLKTFRCVMPRLPAIRWLRAWPWHGASMVHCLEKAKVYRKKYDISHPRLISVNHLYLIEMCPFSGSS